MERVREEILVNTQWMVSADQKIATSSVVGAREIAVALIGNTA
jgi:hypothetical protein